MLYYSEGVCQVRFIRTILEFGGREVFDILTSVEDSRTRKHTWRDVDGLDITNSNSHCMSHISWPAPIIDDTRIRAKIRRQECLYQGLAGPAVSLSFRSNIRAIEIMRRK